MDPSLINYIHSFMKDRVANAEKLLAKILKMIPPKTSQFSCSPHPGTIKHPEDQIHDRPHLSQLFVSSFREYIKTIYSTAPPCETA